MANDSLSKLGKILRSNSMNGTTANEVVSINLLRQKRINEEALTEAEWNSLKRYEKYRKHILDTATSQDDFENKYKQMITLARYTNFEEFLLEKYSV